MKNKKLPWITGAIVAAFSVGMVHAAEVAKSKDVSGVAQGEEKGSGHEGCGKEGCGSETKGKKSAKESSHGEESNSKKSHGEGNHHEDADRTHKSHE